MRRVTVAVVGTTLGTALLVVIKSQLVSDRPPPVAAATQPATNRQPTPAVSRGLGAGSRPAGSAPVRPSTAADRTPGRSWRDGTFQGRAVTNPYGHVQVQVTVSAGRLTDVTPMQLPTAAARGIEIGMRVTPVLRQQALDRQSADLDSMSGATYTCAGYRESLQSALDAALH